MSMMRGDIRTPSCYLGAWRKKKLYGREYDGIARVSFLIGADGKVARIWDPVTAKGHAAEVLAAVEAG